MYAIISTGGKQYRVSEGDVIFIEKLEARSPSVAGAVVTGKVLKNGKGKKITVFTYRPKKGSARKMGHRQPYTKVEIGNIQA